MRPLAPIGPAAALAHGRWVKLICGAGNQDLAAIEDLCAIYALAGVHCIDVAADAAVAAAARRGIAWAAAQRTGGSAAAPWLMLSLSDGDDPHFRKAGFDPDRCPADCPRPCQRVCPALAIGEQGGVLAERCYGCGRCLPACPLGLIEEHQVLLSAEAVPSLLQAVRPDAVELHTQAGRQAGFAARLRQLQASGVPLQRLAVSCGLERGARARTAGSGPSAPALSARELAAELWQRYSLVRAAGYRPLWQLDGRPMSGDVGAGTARAAVKLVEQIRPWAPPGPLQLAGGTNASTLGLLRPDGGAAGVAFGGMARTLLQPLLLEAEQRGRPLRELPELRLRALALARGLVEPWLRR
ncbi:MAG: LdpA C-terminal domain-containing domain [Vulcanococcus sp.]